ncbi:MAG: 5'-3' exonuclease H3TH domain-containing protein, partial [Pseudomonadota bacterium]
MDTEKTLFLVDGSGYLFRAFHAMPSLTNSKGDATGAAFGVTNMLRRLIQEYSPIHAAVVFDAKGKTFRNDMYPEYKANRPPMPDELREQIAPIHEITKAMGFPFLMVPDVEADDVIGTLAIQAREAGMKVFIFTGDKDFAQLVNEDITLINTMNDSVQDIPGVMDKFGVPPELIIDYLALMGDKVDNVPGVEKVGPKTAVKWLTEYGSLDEIMARADEFKGKIGENLRNALTQLPLSRELVTIKCDVELSETPKTLALREPDKDALKDLYTQLEFKTWLSEVLAPTEDSDDGEQSAATSESDYQVILDQADFDAWIKRLEEADVFAFDTETTSLEYMEAQLVGVSFAIKSGEAAYVPVAHDYLGAPAQLSRDAVLNALKPLLEDPNKPKIGQHLKYDAHVLHNYGVEMQGITF